MAVTITPYNRGLYGILYDIAIGIDSLKCMLLKNTYTPDYDLHDHRDDIEAHECTGTAYSAGGVAIGGQVVTQDNTNNQGVLDINDIVFTAVTINSPGARYAAVYVDIGPASSNDPLLYLIDLDSDYLPVAENFTLQIHADGAVRLKKGTA